MISRINPGKYNKKIEIWGKQEIQNELLEEDYEEVKINSIWCSIKSHTTSVQSKALDIVVVNATHKITCRYLSGKNIKEADWFIYRGKRLDIEYVNNVDEMDIELEIYVKHVREGVAVE
jgi:SPP1 family predicted phage head-tail adaptor